MKSQPIRWLPERAARLVIDSPVAPAKLERASTNGSYHKDPTKLQRRRHADLLQGLRVKVSAEGWWWWWTGLEDWVYKGARRATTKGESPGGSKGKGEESKRPVTASWGLWVNGANYITRAAYYCSCWPHGRSSCHATFDFISLTVPDTPGSSYLILRSDITLDITLCIIHHFAQMDSYFFPQERERNSSQKDASNLHRQRSICSSKKMHPKEWASNLHRQRSICSCVTHFSFWSVE